MMMLAIDIGGTKTALALLDDQQVIVEKKQISTAFDHWEECAQALKLEANSWEFDSVVVATTGRVVNGVLEPLNTEMISFWQHLPIETLLKGLFNKPVTILNDAAAAAFCEYNALAPTAPTDNLLYLTVSTGVGSGLVVNNQLVSSANGLASHAGHSQHNIYEAEVNYCSCGRENCIETIASGTAIAKRASKLCNENLTTIEVFDRFNSDQRCALVINQSAQAIATLIANVNAIVGLDTVVLGGGVGLNRLYLEQVQHYLKALPAAYQVVIKQAALAENSGLLGVAQWAASR